MDDPFTGTGAPVRLQRACERNRLEKGFLSHAYECLVAVVTVGECPRRQNERFSPLDYQRESSVHRSIIPGGAP